MINQFSTNSFLINIIGKYKILDNPNKFSINILRGGTTAKGGGAVAPAKFFKTPY